ncbi:RDD family protein [Actinoplanes missouriensis]|uniref:RDD family protein n=1 Tax=Actinoplanes missouriensis TaxID=1866 RepID=UPI0033F95214
MTVSGTARQTRLEIAQELATPVLGRRAAKRIAAFETGELYVEAGLIARTLSWFVDFLVFAAGGGAAFVLMAGATASADLSDTTVTLLALALLVIVPMLYGLWYGNGRALGAILTGTRLVRVRDGGRIGRKACWAMLLRTVLMPLLIIVMIVSMFDGGVPSADGSVVRTSIDRDATERLRALDIPER